MKFINRSTTSESVRPAWQPVSAWVWMFAAVAAVVIATFVVTTWLLAIASKARSGTDLANADLDAVRTGLAAGAGAGAAVGLMLAFRRQHHQEIVTVLTDLDATERRITELYTKAVEQLGSDKAPVRLGGLYALERLAQDNHAHRQTIVNVFCAYLRMPFPPESWSRFNRAQDSKAIAEALKDTWEQEKQVRLTAQSILADHLRKHQDDPDSISGRFWPDIRIDLRGATLIDFGFHDVTVEEVWFDGATFIGIAQFYRATFASIARFEEATFASDATFSSSIFSCNAKFNNVRFNGQTWFSMATFDGAVEFNDAAFEGNTLFYKTDFNGLAEFQSANFDEDVSFARSTFGQEISFNTTTFAKQAEFGGAMFSNNPSVLRVTFGGTVNFEGAIFSEGADGLLFARTRVLVPEAPHVWPTGWHTGPPAESGCIIVRDKKGSARRQQ
jgi:hypothetical protein